MKTNKSYTKRLKITKSGKLLSRKIGQDKNLAKENNRQKSAKRGNREFHMSNKTRSRYLLNIK